MHWKFSSMAKKILLANIILSLLVLGIHIYNINQIRQTSLAIHQEIDNQLAITGERISRRRAIEILQKSGANLFLGDEFFTFFGTLMSITTIGFTYFFSRNYNFNVGMAAALFSLLATFIGGFLMFYLLFSDKTGADLAGVNLTRDRPKSDWETFIHNRSKDIK